MFFILSKMLSALPSPFLWLILLWIFYFWVKAKRPKQLLLWPSISLFILFSNNFIVGTFVALWKIPGTKTDECKTFDYGIVLSGMFEYSATLDRLSAKRGSDRLWQAIHMRRAEACFQKEGLECSTFSTDHYYDPSSAFSLASIIPSAEAFVIWNRMIRERIGTLMYKILG
jgi:uncharacterized SAM-binding protein YcdF (DUF218 family)